MADNIAVTALMERETDSPRVAGQGAVILTTFKNKSGREIPILKIPVTSKNNKRYYVRIGIKKAQAVIEYQKEIVEVVEGMVIK